MATGKADCLSLELWNQLFAMLVEEGESALLLPIRIEEHPPDVLGPRMIDEVRGPDGTGTGAIVRHLVRGFEYADWSAARVQELEDLICSEPLEHDPLQQLVAENDWIAWQTRRSILQQPGPDDSQLRQRLGDEVFTGQRGDSWRTPTTSRRTTGKTSGSRTTSPSSAATGRTRTAGLGPTARCRSSPRGPAAPPSSSGSSSATSTRRRSANGIRHYPAR